MEMAEHALWFSSLLNRLTLIGVTVVTSPPAPAGFVYLFGKKDGIVPYAKGPMVPMKARAASELIPAPMVKRLLKHLEIRAEDQSQFWAIEEYGHPTA
jgi:hypothetical protein